MSAGAEVGAAVFDTNILIDFLNGFQSAHDALSRWNVRFISPITWIEVMVGARQGEEARLRAFLDHFQRVPLDDLVAETAVSLRRQYRIRLPDALIWATAQSKGAILITRNTKDFQTDHPGIRVPYRV